MNSLLAKLEALAAKLGTDVETLFAEFEAFVEGKKSAEDPEPIAEEKASEGNAEPTEPTASTEAPDASAQPAETSAEASSETAAEESKAE